MIAALIFIPLGSLLFLLSFPVILELTLFIGANLIYKIRGSKLPKEKITTPIKKIALLVPAHNEAIHIQRCVKSLLASKTGAFQREVVVIADNCDDNTATLAKEAGARVLERFNQEIRGKGAALHYAITLLEGEDWDAYIIVDADSIVSDNFLEVMGKHFETGKEALQCTYLVLNVEASQKNKLMNLALLSMNVFRPLGREILGASVGIMGNGFGLTKKLLQEVPYTANSITEDLEYHLELITRGRKVRFIPEVKVLADFPVAKEGIETQRARWEGGRFLLQRKFFLPLLGKIFQGKTSLIEPFFELMSMPLAYVVLFLLGMVFLPFPFFTFWGLGGLFIIFLQTVLSIIFNGDTQAFKAFLEVPGYLLWKILKLPLILLNSKKGAQWVRTSREEVEK